MNEIASLLGCRYPIIQGAMGVISNPEMVAAVSAAGGFGVLATAFFSELQGVRDQILAVRKLTDQPFGLNLAGFNPQSPLFAEMAVEMGLKAVTTSAGSPRDLVPYLKKKGLTVFHVVANVTGALGAEATGVDGVIAEGTESGGLQGKNGVATMVLIPAVVDAVKVPVVAAGGIADKRGFQAALALGAKGVQMGTRFIASTECMAHQRCKELIVRAKETDTVLFQRDRFLVRMLKAPESESFFKAPDFDDYGERLNRTWVDGRLEDAPITVGQVVGLIHEIKPVKEIIDEIMN